MRIQLKNIHIGANGTIIRSVFFTATECDSMRSTATCNLLLFDKSVLPTNRDNRVLPNEKWFMSETQFRECGLAPWLAQHEPADNCEAEVPPVTT